MLWIYSPFLRGSHDQRERTSCSEVSAHPRPAGTEHWGEQAPDRHWGVSPTGRGWSPMPTACKCRKGASPTSGDGAAASMPGREIGESIPAGRVEARWRSDQFIMSEGSPAGGVAEAATVAAGTAKSEESPTARGGPAPTWQGYWYPRDIPDRAGRRGRRDAATYGTSHPQPVG